MFAVGHFALGYIFGKTSSKIIKVKVNLPLLLADSVLPDVDLLLRFLAHRGPTHSLITITVLMVPFFAVYRKRALPYYAAMLSHILIGDFFRRQTAFLCVIQTQARAFLAPLTKHVWSAKLCDEQHACRVDGAHPFLFNPAVDVQAVRSKNAVKTQQQELGSNNPVRSHYWSSGFA